MPGIILVSLPSAWDGCEASYNWWKSVNPILVTGTDKIAYGHERW